MSSFYYPDSPPKIVLEVQESNFNVLGRKVANAPVLCGPSTVGNTHFTYAESII